MVPFAPTHTLAGLIEKLATGAAFTVMFCVVVELQVPEVTVSEIVLAPADDQLTVCGPAVEAVAGVAPTPKFQL